MTRRPKSRQTLTKGATLSEGIAQASDEGARSGTTAGRTTNGANRSRSGLGASATGGTAQAARMADASFLAASAAGRTAGPATSHAAPTAKVNHRSPVDRGVGRSGATDRAKGMGGRKIQGRTGAGALTKEAVAAGAAVGAGADAADQATSIAPVVPAAAPRVGEGRGGRRRPAPRGTSLTTRSAFRTARPVQDLEPTFRDAQNIATAPTTPPLPAAAFRPYRGCLAAASTTVTTPGPTGAITA